ncbi:hypothetical protein B0H15DRAFT_944945 [Mycena belliarum]|uniref:Uncharacterized protein n=1 Tax=Mycena belliarum TaxID=1033014 RepID=A0AAD6UDM6_9AGAR|nr:hypothetical protein B0H15DRAFT_944945 [Mycena belliae]
MCPRISLVLLSLLALAAASPIDEKLQPVIAWKNNIGLINPPTPHPNAASGSALSSVAGTALAVGAIAILI